MIFDDPTTIIDQEGANIEYEKYNIITPTLKFDSNKELLSSLEAIGSAAGAAALASSGPTLMTGADPTIMWALINLLQMFYYLLFVNTELPKNLKSYLQIFKVGTLSFLPNPAKIIFPDLEEESLSAPERFEDSDVDGMFLVNAGSMILIWILAMVLLVLVIIILRYFKSMPAFIDRLLKKLKKALVWSGVFKVWIMTYLELTMASFLQIRVM